MALLTTAGALLVATPPLADPSFDRTVVYIVEHNEQGALGLVINRPSGERLPDVLAEWETTLAEPQRVFSGGPVELGTIIGVAQAADDVSSVATVDLNDPAGHLSVRRLRVFRGYAGWSAGQLEGELLAGAWIVVAADPDDIFSAEPSELWRTVLRRQGGNLAWLANAPDDLSMN